MGRILKPPQPLDLSKEEKSIFLGGSIDDGRVVHWQTFVANELGDLPVTVLNPRRDAWDDTWKQTIEDPVFVEQVTWELDAQEKATLIVLYFAPQTRAPITLLELGLFARTGKVIVCCPEGFWRKGNVELVCRRFGISVVESLEKLVRAVRERLV